VTIVAEIDTNLAEAEVEDRKAKIARAKIMGLIYIIPFSLK